MNPKYCKEIARAVGQVMRINEIISEDVWHGSPHRFDKFDMSRINTGEGAQMYGWGLYFASKKEVAAYYQKNVKSIESKPRRFFNDQELEQGTPEYQAASLLDGTYSLASVRKEVRDWIKNARGDEDVERYQRILDILERATSKASFSKKPPMFLYSVTIPDEKYLLWDKPLSEQPVDVTSVINKILTTTPTMFENPGMMTGEQFYEAMSKWLGDEKEASLVLLKAGIYGIKYLDADSRIKTRNRSFNYVVFDDSVAKINSVHMKG